MHSPWVPVGLIYLGILLFWLLNRRLVRCAARSFDGAERQKIADVLARLPASEQDRLAAIARSGETIEAIKELRTKAGTDLATAKATVDGLAIFRPPS